MSVMSIKKNIGRLLLSPEMQSSWTGALARRLVRATDGMYRYSPAFKIDMQAVERPHYAWCMMRAAELGKAL